MHDVICANCACVWNSSWGGGGCGILSFRGLLVALSDDGRVVLTVNVHVTSLVCWKLRSRNWIVGGAQFQLGFKHWLLWMVFLPVCVDKCWVGTFSYSIAPSFDILFDILFSCYLAIQNYVDWGVHIVSNKSYINKNLYQTICREVFLFWFAVAINGIHNFSLPFSEHFHVYGIFTFSVINF